MIAPSNNVINAMFYVPNIFKGQYNGQYTSIQVAPTGKQHLLKIRKYANDKIGSPDILKRKLQELGINTNADGKFIAHVKSYEPPIPFVSPAQIVVSRGTNGATTKLPLYMVSKVNAPTLGEAKMLASVINQRTDTSLGSNMYNSQYRIRRQRDN